MSLAAPTPSTIQRILLSNWHRIEKFIKDWADWMPNKDNVLGCGHYGCVLQTNDPNVVVKVTSDASEIDFIDKAIDFDSFPLGIVKYHELLRLPVTYYKRPVALVWRESAQNVGKLQEIYDPCSIFDPRGAGCEYDRYQKKVYAEFVSYLKIFNYASHRLKAYYDDGMKWDDYKEHLDWAAGYVNYEEALPDWLKGPRKAAACLVLAEISIKMLRHDSSVGYLIGEALEFYLERGLLLADVHTGNIGQVYRPGFIKLVNVITDPGHVVVIK